MFKDKTLLITGGTGSFGNAVLRRFLNTDIGEIRIFSRDEKKQHDLLRRYNNPKIKCYVGDVRDMFSIRNVMRGADYVFHAAALKQVPSCEVFPLEAIKTNAIGTANVIDAAIDAKVQRLVCLSTDKAAYPVSAMGASKMLMEKIFTARARVITRYDTTICGTRFGNVMASRGSVIPLFIDLIKTNKPLTLTHLEMTRFMMSLEEAVELVVYAFTNAESGDIIVMKSPACTVKTIAEALFEIFEINTGIEIIGVRRGEAMYETLLTKEEATVAIDMGNFYKVPLESDDLNYKKYCEPVDDESVIHVKEFTSNNAKQLNVEQLKEKLLSLDYIKLELERWSNMIKYGISYI